MEDFKPFSISTCEMAASGNPGIELAPDPDKPLSRFTIRDPWELRNAIVPVFRQDSTGRIYGYGTGFGTDQFGTFLTAHHVVDYPVGDRPVLMLSPGVLAYGNPPVPDDCFVHVAGMQVVTMEVEDPFAALLGNDERAVGLDIAVLQASPHGAGVEAPHTLPVQVHDWEPTEGEVILAVGFPELDLSELDAGADRMLLAEGMFGAYGRIVKVHANGVSTTNRSPVFEVEGDWPAGMSGGPVFNCRGEVIGIVSRSLEPHGDHPGCAFAVDLVGCRQIQPFGPRLDSPGFQLCWGLFAKGSEKLLSVHVDEPAALQAGSGHAQPTMAKQIANRIGTDDWVDAQ